MSAYEVTDEVEKRIASGEYDWIIMNYANWDMVGHTGVMQAAVDAVEAGFLVAGVDAVRRWRTADITADHGNAEQMWDEAEMCLYRHTVSNPVPFIGGGRPLPGQEIAGGRCLRTWLPRCWHRWIFPSLRQMTGHSLLPRRSMIRVVIADTAMWARACAWP